MGRGGRWGEGAGGLTGMDGARATLNPRPPVPAEAAARCYDLAAVKMKGKKACGDTGMQLGLGC